MSQIRCLGDRHGQAVWVTIGYRESLRGYYMLVESLDGTGRRHPIYSSSYRRQLLSCQKALTHLGVRVPRHTWTKMAHQSARHQAAHDITAGHKTSS
ncbi:hypothetical protein ACEK07_04860 [Alcanivoracaceae bacterium MT1]